MGADTVTLLAHHTRRASNGRHRCGWCGKRIAAGERYTDQRIADNGTVYTWREHPACAARIWKWAYAHGLRDDDFTDAREMWADMLADEEPTP
jgi:hypothetical protein